MGDKLSSPQFLALRSAVNHGSPTYHIHGQSAWGGWGGTRAALQRKGYLDISCQITEAGRAAYEREAGIVTLYTT